MLGKRFLQASVTAISLFLLVLTGCGPKADLSLSFDDSRVNTYRTVQETLKDFEFVQPSLDKQDKKQTGTIAEAVFNQEIENVDADGNAHAKITIRELVYTVKGKEGITYSFDSKNSQDMNSKKLADLIGNSYTIKIMPNGKAQVINAQAARATVKGGYDARVAKSFLSNESIEDRHSIAALPEDPKEMTKGQTWTVKEPSPKGLLAKKDFEKVYTLRQVDGQKAIVEMQAKGGQGSYSQSQMGFFANMFDTNESYTGRMVLNLETGRVHEYKEELVATYTAVDAPDNSKSEKGPDTLTMGFTQKISLEMIK